MKVKNIMFSGFAAAILMGTVDANAALSIASKDYVDTQVGALSGNGGAITSLQTRMTTAESDIDALEEKVGENSVQSQINTALNSYTNTTDMNTAIANAVATETQNRQDADSALQTAINAKASQTDLTALAGRVTANENIISSTGQTIPSTIGSTTNVATIVGAINALNTKTEDIASSDTVSGINTRLQTAEGKIDTLTGNGAGSVAKAEADAKAYADSLANNYDAAGAADAVDAKLGGNYSDQSTVADAIALKANSADVYTTSQTYTKTEVDNLLNAKQGTLTSAQLAAANSGIDATAKASYDAVVDTMGGTCTSESDYCALVKGPNGTITWVEITNPFTAGTSGNNNNDNPNG